VCCGKGKSDLSISGDSARPASISLLCVREMQIGIWEKFLGRQTTVAAAAGYSIMAPRVKSERK